MLLFFKYAKKCNTVLFIAVAIGLMCTLGLFFTQTASAANEAISEMAAIGNNNPLNSDPTSTAIGNDDPFPFASPTPDETPSAGNGAISGMVTSTNPVGPLGNVEVFVTNDYDVYEYGYTDWQSGMYTVGNIPTGIYNVTFSMYGYHSVTLRNIQVTDGQTKSNVNVSLVPLGSVSGLVTAADTGEPIGDVQVTVTNNNDVYEYSWADWESGAYTVGNIPTGIYNVTFSMYGYHSVTLDNIQVIDGQVTTDVNASLVPLGSVSGFVTAADTGEPIGDVQVTVTNNNDVYEYSGTDWESGAYTVVNIPSGTYNVTFSASSYQSVTLENIAVTDGQTTTDVNAQLFHYTSSIAGTVTSDTGQPLEGAEVCISSNQNSLYQCTYTDSLGAYTSYLPAGTYSISFHLYGYQSVTLENIFVTHGQTKSDVNASLVYYSGSISGLVTASDMGELLGDVQVTVTNDQNVYEYGYTDWMSGTYTVPLPPGTYNVTFSHYDYQSVTLENIQVLDGQTTTDVNVSLVSRYGNGCIEGVVTSDTGEPIGDVGISVFNDYGVYQSSWSDWESGTYMVCGLPSGTYNVTFSHYDYQSVTLENIQVLDGQTTTDVNASLAPLYGNGSITGLVTSDTGEPLGNVGISVFNDYGVYQSSWSDWETGAYTIWNLPTGTYNVTFHYACYEPVTLTNVQVIDGQTTNDVNAIISRATGTASISGKVTDMETNAPLSDIYVDLMMYDDMYWWSQSCGSVATTPDGTYSFTNLPAGTYTINFSDWNNSYFSVSDSVSLEDGIELTKDVAMQRGGWVEATLTDTDGKPISGACFDVYAQNTGAYDRLCVDENGYYSSPLLPADTYEIWFDDGTTLGTVQVVGGETNTVHFSVKNGPHFSASTYTVDEDAGEATITVEMSSGFTQTVQVNYAIESDACNACDDWDPWCDDWSCYWDATPDVDYTPVQGTLTFNPGETNKTFTIPIAEDTEKESAEEEVSMWLSDGPWGAPSSATLYIRDNDWGKISGTITAPDLSNVHVFLWRYYLDEWYNEGGWWSQEQEQLVNPEDGSYAFDMLDVGTYAIQAVDYSGLAKTMYYPDADTTDTATHIEVTDTNKDYTAINMTLPQGGIISGQITNPPLWGNAVAYFWDGAFWQWAGYSSINADDGTYRIGGLSNGTYRVEFNGDSYDENGNSLWYTRYYQDAWSLDEATDVVVVEGEETILDTISFGLTDVDDVTDLPVDLYIYKYTEWNSRAQAGQNLDFYLDIGNWMIGTAKNITITDTLPPEMSFVSQENPWGVTPTVDNEHGTVTWSIPEFAPYTYGWIRMTVKIDDNVAIGSSLTNQVDIATNSTDNSLENNSYELSVVVQGTPGTIAGKVYAHDGSTPLAYVGVNVFDTNGNWVSWGMTDEDGSYRIENLDGGTQYKLHFEDWGGWWLGRSTTYPDEYYQNTDSLDEATPVTVVSGEVTTVDITLNEPAPPRAEVELPESNTEVSVSTDPKTGKVEIGKPSWAEVTTDVELTYAATCPNNEEPARVQLEFVSNDRSGSFIGDMSSIGEHKYRGTLPANSINHEGTINVIVTCGDDSTTVEIGAVVLIDPSGNITDALTGEPIVGARVELYKLEGWTPKTGADDERPYTCHTPETMGETHDWMTLPPAPQEGMPANPFGGEIDPQQNPLLTNDVGRYAWDVKPDACWYVVVESPGYETRVSPAVGVVEEPITDLDMTLMPLMVQFETTTAQVTESKNNHITYTVGVSLTTAMATDVAVDYAITGGTATRGTDYTATEGTLTFAPGERYKTIDIVVKPDAMDEEDEYVVLSLQNPTNMWLRNGYTTLTLTIVDNDNAPDVYLRTETLSVNEGSGNTTVAATLSAASTKAITVTYTTKDGTATVGSDYTAASGTLLFAPGETVKTITVDINNDPADEDDETFTINLSEAINAALSEPKQATVTIVDNDETPSLSFSSATYDVDEGAGKAVITATLTAVSAKPVTVQYITNNGIATAGSDYTASTATLAFAAGETVKNFTVVLHDDIAVEGNETFTITLRNVVHATLGEPQQATVTIVDNDNSAPQPDDDEPTTAGETPNVSLSSATYSVGEAVGSATVTATLSITPTQTVIVTYTTEDGTAMAGSDYTPVTDTLTFAPGDIVKTFSIAITNDTDDEEDETFMVSLNNPVNAILTQPQQATVTIVDDDEPTDDDPTDDDPTDTITNTITAAQGGTITSTNGIVVTFPAGAVAEDVIVQVTDIPTTTNAMPSGSLGVRHFIITAFKKSDSMSVTTFVKPFTITIPYTNDDMDRLTTQGLSETAMTMSYWNGNMWEKIDTDIDAANNVATASVDHLTEFALLAQASQITSNKLMVYLPLISR